MRHTAEMIQHNARNIGLNTQLDNLTEGFGNCFYHGCTQQLRRIKNKSLDYHQLRRNVAQYVYNNRGNAFCKKFQMQEKMSDQHFLNYILDQGQNGTYAETLFITATASYLDTDIRITSSNSNSNRPFYTIHKSNFMGLSNSENDSYIFLGHAGEHFQSLILQDESISLTGSKRAQIPYSPANGIPGQSISSPPSKKLYSHAVKCDNKEEDLKKKYNDLGLPYCSPPAGETNHAKRSRQQKMSLLLKREVFLKSETSDYGISYTSPKHENIHQRHLQMQNFIKTGVSDKKLIQDAIDVKSGASPQNSDDIDFNIETNKESSNFQSTSSCCDSGYQTGLVLNDLSPSKAQSYINSPSSPRKTFSKPRKSKHNKSNFIDWFDKCLSNNTKSERIDLASTIGSTGVGVESSNVNDGDIGQNKKYCETFIGDTKKNEVLDTGTSRIDLASAIGSTGVGVESSNVNDGDIGQNIKYCETFIGDTKKNEVLGTGTSPPIDKFEEQLKREVISAGLSYNPPSAGESVVQRRKRRRNIRKIIKRKKSAASSIVESQLKNDLIAAGLSYHSPPKGESVKQRKHRRRNTRKLLNNHSSITEDQLKNEALTAGLAYQSPRSDVQNDLPFLDPTVETTFCQENRENIHSNPKVVDSILNFEDGEKKHSIDQCVTCLEIRPVFYPTPSTHTFNKNDPKIPTKNPWKILKDQRCKRCHDEKRDVKNKPIKILKFSGIHSPESDLPPITLNNKIRHNNMHFSEQPPFLKNLTLVELALVSKISVIMNIHILKKFGMFSYTGHTVSLPQKMKIATELPLLPEEVNILLITRKNSKNSNKHYTVQRDSVQKALEGLCFGFPHGGVDFPNDTCTKKYDGKNHCSGVILHGKFFQHLPNPYYFDVSIQRKRIVMLPESRNFLDGLRVLERDNIFDNNPIELNEDEEIASSERYTHSGLIYPVQPNNCDEELRSILRKLLGEDAGEAVEGAQVARAHWDRISSEPLNELKTPGFFFHGVSFNFYGWNM